VTEIGPYALPTEPATVIVLVRLMLASSLAAFAVNVSPTHRHHRHFVCFSEFLSQALSILSVMWRPAQSQEPRRRQKVSVVPVVSVRRWRFQRPMLDAVGFETSVLAVIATETTDSMWCARHLTMHASGTSR